MSENIIEKRAGPQFIEDYSRYSVYVLYKRIAPDFRDGLKPVNRRILWTMFHDTKATTKTVKSATNVGAVLKYHPHGDASVYGAIKPMTNWFESNQPYIQGKGNWGTFDGDPQAASRYTECKLNDFAINYMIGDIKSTTKAVDWSPNYSKETVEPDFLPAAAPMLLINGVFGIGVGLKAEIPTHNISEVIDATLKLIKNPNYEPVLIPDHCMMCDIVDTDWKKISQQGFGTYTIRARIDIEKDKKNRDILVIKGIPNLCYLDNITDKIEALVENKTIIQIANAHSESTQYAMRYVITLKPGSDPYFVREMLYKSTDLEQTNRINFIALNGLQAVRMSYKSYLQSFIEFRKLTKFRVYKNMLQQVQTAIHEKDAYIKVLEFGEIDKIIDMIKKQKSIDDHTTVEYLIKKLNITDIQAEFIINANIKKLSMAYLNKYKEEAATLNIEKDRLMTFLVDENAIVQDIVNELKEINKKYGRPRICRVVSNDIASNVPKGKVQLVVTENNFLKKLPMGVKAGNIKDNYKQMIVLDNTDTLVIFDDAGRMFSLPVHKIPFVDRTSTGVDIRYMIKKFTSEISIIIAMSIIKKNVELNQESDYNRIFLVTASKNGMVKRIDLDDVLTAPPSGTVYAKLDDGDRISCVKIANIVHDAIIYSENKAIRIPMENIPYLKRNTKGNKLMQLSEGSYVEGICFIPSKEKFPNSDHDIEVITKLGKINRIDGSALPISKRRTGTSVIRLGSKDSIKAIVSAACESDSICITTLYNKKIIIPVEDIPFSSSISPGVKIQGIEKGDCVIQAQTIRRV